MKIVFLTGAGMSVESGFRTFRGSDGLWENYPVEQVASHEGWERDPVFVNNFYNMLRHKLYDAKPNRGHELIAELEKQHTVSVITQNVDDLHERAGSTRILHLHGELMKVRTMTEPWKYYTLDEEHIETSPDTRINGEPVRPHIVFFQEGVPNIERAIEWASEADIFVVIGTSLVVYPAAALLHYVRKGVPIYYIDPRPAAVPANVHVIKEPATQGVAELVKILKPKD